MTEPSGRRRRRRSGEPGSSSWTSGSQRGLLALVGIAVIVLAAAGLSVALGGGGVTPSQGAVGSASSSGSPSREPAPSFPAVGSSSAPSIASPSQDATPVTTPSPVPGKAIKAKRIQIDRLGIDLKIIEGDGIDAPLGKAAHYPGTGWPGGGTNIYIYGHAQTGMFLSLWDVKIGDVAVLTLVDGTQRTYTVDKIIPRAPWDAIQYLDPTPRERLTLQTSTSYHPTSPRFVVIALPTP